VTQLQYRLNTQNLARVYPLARACELDNR
jgi:hypothetical protein